MRCASLAVRLVVALQLLSPCVPLYCLPPRRLCDCASPRSLAQLCCSQQRNAQRCAFRNALTSACTNQLPRRVCVCVCSRCDCVRAHVCVRSCVRACCARGVKSLPFFSSLWMNCGPLALNLRRGRSTGGGAVRSTGCCTARCVQSDRAPAPLCPMTCSTQRRTRRLGMAGEGTASSWSSSSPALTPRQLACAAAPAAFPSPNMNLATVCTSTEACDSSVCALLMGLPTCSQPWRTQTRLML